MNVTLGLVTNTTISLSWEEPEEKNGELLAYTVEWMLCDHPESQDLLDFDETDLNCDESSSSHALLPPSEFNYIIENLKPYSLYLVEVFANTSAGRGIGEPFEVTTDPKSKVPFWFQAKKLLCFHLESKLFDSLTVFLYMSMIIYDLISHSKCADWLIDGSFVI